MPSAMSIAAIVPKNDFVTEKAMCGRSARQRAEVALVDDAAAMQDDDAIRVVRGERLSPRHRRAAADRDERHGIEVRTFRARQTVATVPTLARQLIVGANSRQCEKLHRHCGKR